MFDFTDMGGNARQQNTERPQFRQVRKPQDAHPVPEQKPPTSLQDAGEQIASNPNLDFPVDPEVERVKELEARRSGRLFNITDSRGQIKAGEVDKAQEEFLKNTTWAE